MTLKRTPVRETWATQVTRGTASPAIQARRSGALNYMLLDVVDLLLAGTKALSHCKCKAITFYLTDGTQCSAARSFINSRFPGLLDALKNQGAPNPATATCPHCAEHLGFDLCGCGSGQPYTTCPNHWETCRLPIQKVSVPSAS